MVSPGLTTDAFFQDDLEEVYRSRFDGLVPNGAEQRIFQCFMVMAIGMLLVKKDISTPYLISDQLLTSAAKIAEERPVAIFRGDLDHLEVLVRGQFISLHPGASGAYYAVSLAIRLAADHGLHETNRIVELLQDLSDYVCPLRDGSHEQTYFSPSLPQNYTTTRALLPI